MAIVIDHMDAHMSQPPPPAAAAPAAGAAKPDATAILRVLRLAAERRARLAAD